MHEGHRNRLRERWNLFPESFSQYEILEIVLFQMIPRKNTNELAHVLISRFGNLENVVNAPPEELMKVKGVGIKTAQKIGNCKYLVHYSKISPQKKIKLSKNIETYEYLGRKFCGREDEVLIVLCLDENYKLINEFEYTSFELHKVEVAVNKVSCDVASAKPKYVLIAHNHPHGKVEPSKLDDVATLKLYMATSFLGIEFLDHVIFNESEFFSYRTEGNLDKIKKLCEMQTHNILTNMEGDRNE